MFFFFLLPRFDFFAVMTPYSTLIRDPYPTTDSNYKPAKLQVFKVIRRSILSPPSSAKLKVTFEVRAGSAFQETEEGRWPVGDHPVMLKIQWRPFKSLRVNVSLRKF